MVLHCIPHDFQGYSRESPPIPGTQSSALPAPCWQPNNSHQTQRFHKIQSPEPLHHAAILLHFPKAQPGLFLSVQKSHFFKKNPTQLRPRRAFTLIAPSSTNFCGLRDPVMALPQKPSPESLKVNSLYNGKSTGAGHSRLVQP